MTLQLDKQKWRLKLIMMKITIYFNLHPHTPNLLKRGNQRSYLSHNTEMKNW